MQKLQSLYQLSEALDKSWCENERLEYDEAELLIDECKRLNSELLCHLPSLPKIIAYSIENDDWDSGEVANWPTIIRDDINKYYIEKLIVGNKYTFGDDLTQILYVGPCDISDQYDFAMACQPDAIHMTLEVHDLPSIKPATT
jgi:hypothetical protein